MARPARLELATFCLEVSSRCAISLLFLGSAYLLQHDFVWYSGVIGPKLDPTFWGEPLGWHNFFGHSFRFLKAFLHLLAGEGVWGRGRHLSPFPQ